MLTFNSIMNEEVGVQWSKFSNRRAKREFKCEILNLYKNKI